MKYTLTEPCPDCPFLKKNAKSYGVRRLKKFCRGEFHCHKTGKQGDDSGDYIPISTSLHCAGALIFLEKRSQPHQMMRICERLGMYDRTKLKMDAPVV